jgi:hypothetical protein
MMTLSPRLPSGLACDTAGSGPAGAALGTRRAIGLVGAHNLQGLAGATADGGTWTVRNGSIQIAPSDRKTPA